MKSNYAIRNVAVLGSGVMGSQIAAHCVNAGLNVMLLDLKSDDPKRPDKIAEENIKNLTKMAPAPLALAKFAHRIKAGNFEDHMKSLSKMDWIIEVVVERMDIKKKIMAQIDAVRKPAAIVSSNTSGLPITQVGEECSKEMKAHFLGTHFFNPPRYMRLLELIPTADTSPEVVSYLKQFCERRLGKGVVVCNDTPNFIANRIGIFSMASLMPSFFDGSFRAEEIDTLTGTLTGYSKGATFRTADLAGLDVVKHVSENLLPSIPDDERKEVFKLPEAFNKMVDSGLNGNKSGAGFYKKIKTKTGAEYHVINPETMEFEPQQSIEEETIAAAKKSGKTAAARLKFLVSQDNRIGNFVWKMQRDLLLYSAHRIPEIADSPLAIDRAMRWGFNWEMGPFQRWDALGVQETASRLKQEGATLPIWLEDMLKAGISNFYDYENHTVYDPLGKKMIPISDEAEGELTVAHLKRGAQPVLKTPSASLHDMGDGIALFEFTTKQATLGFELLETLEQACEKVNGEFAGMVISHDGEHFAYGANLMEAFQAVKAGEMGKVQKAVDNFQRIAVGLRYQPFPVVAAPFGRTLGGGCEFMLHADKVVAHHELYTGLVEVGVGLIPAGGGTKELLIRFMNKLEGDADPLAYVREAFKTIGMAKVSESAEMAKELEYLHPSDVVVMNRNLLLRTAKSEALALYEAGYTPPAEAMIKVYGQNALSMMEIMLYIMHESRFITDYDKELTMRVAHVLAGGDLSEPQLVPEKYILKLERDAIMECFRDERTLARIEHMLTTGKPLRN